MPRESASHLHQSDGEPRKAYLVSYTITNGMSGVIYADSVADARRRFREGDYDQDEFEYNGVDGRTGGVTVKRVEGEDRNG